MKHILLLAGICLAPVQQTFCWGFYAHRQINYYAVFLLPPAMTVFYKKHILFLSEHATDPDKRRYALKDEASRHFIDIDHYGSYPYPALPRNWTDAVEKYSEDSLLQHGIAPWWIQVMQARLTKAFSEKNLAKILRLSAEIGHYVGDAHVPLHASSNHNGQHTNQHGIHGFWESRIPELFAASRYDFLLGRAEYLEEPGSFVWERILESARAADTVLKTEKTAGDQFPADRKFAFEDRNGTVLRQYSGAYANYYDRMLDGMVERRMRQSIFAVASCWYTAWVDAGQPDLTGMAGAEYNEADLKEWEILNREWLNGLSLGRSCSN
jgi:hypothetical protein